MKKGMVMLILVITVLSLSACTSKTEIDETENVRQENVEKDDKSKNQIYEEGQESEDEVETEVPKEKISVNVYKADSDGETLVAEVKECEQLNEKTLWELLKETTSIPEKSIVNSLKVDGDKLELDVDKLFGDKLRSYGTSGENVLMGCVVNTYLDTYKAQSIKITEEGQVLCSGHREYSDYLTRY